MGMGTGMVAILGKYIDREANTDNDRDAFMAGCKDKITTCTLVGCYVGATDKGLVFLQQLADGGQMNVQAPDGNIYYKADKTCLFNEGGIWVPAFPQ